MKRNEWMSKVAMLTVAMMICIGLGSGAAFAAETAKVSGVVNLNTASAKQLQALPGIGAKKAQAIVQARSQKAFGSVNELVKVRGIGQRMLQKLKPYLRVNGQTTIKSLNKGKKKGRRKG